MRRLIVEPAVPEHDAPQLWRVERQFPDFDRIGSAKFLRDLAAEHGQKIRLQQHRAGRSEAC